MNLKDVEWNTSKYFLDLFIYLCMDGSTPLTPFFMGFGPFAWFCRTFLFCFGLKLDVWISAC